MRAPTVHLNGTGGQALLDAATEAREAVENAIAKMVVAAPNARDYYPQGDHAYAIARGDYERLVANLTVVVDELMELAFEISQQIPPEKLRLEAEEADIDGTTPTH